MKEYDINNVFAQIIEGKIPCNKVYEDDMTIAFHDLHPAAPLHILVIPKNRYISYDDFIAHASAIDIAGFFRAVHAITKKFSLDDSGYRLITNHGRDAMQTIPHFHVHILGKTKLGPLVISDSYHSKEHVEN